MCCRQTLEEDGEQSAVTHSHIHSRQSYPQSAVIYSHIHKFTVGNCTITHSAVIHSHIHKFTFRSHTFTNSQSAFAQSHSPQSHLHRHTVTLSAVAHSHKQAPGNVAADVVALVTDVGPNMSMIRLFFFFKALHRNEERVVFLTLY